MVATSLSTSDSMRFIRPLRLTLALWAALTTVACSDATAPQRVTGPNFVRLTSDANDYVGGGANYEYTQQNAVITVTTAGGRLVISISGDEFWNGVFQSPTTLHYLQPGTYENLQQSPAGTGAAGVYWDGEGRGCGSVIGSFTVNDVEYDRDSLTAVDLTFEQHCDGATAALHGTIHWRADDTTRPPGPATPVPAGLWTPPAGATPATGNFVYLQSDAGDAIGQGRIFSYPSMDSTIVVSGRGSHVGVMIGAAGGWQGDFQRMNTLYELEPGYYG